MSILIAMLLSAGPLDQTFSDGANAYAEERYTDAIAKYEELVFSGVEEPEVFFNLGNAYYRGGYVSPAIANYERALLLDPTLEPARHNLRRSVSQTKRGLSRPQPPGWEQALLFWHFSLNRHAAASAALLFWIAAWLLLAVRFLKPVPYLRAGALLCLALALASGTSWWVKTHPDSLAVAAGDHIPVRYGNTTDDTVRFELFEGDRVRVETRADGWMRIRTPDDERGWVQRQFMIPVGPPFTSPTVKLDRGGETEKDGQTAALSTKARRGNDDAGV
jgi:tetratricopeptide (TPR) repeat protein